MSEKDTINEFYTKDIIIAIQDLVLEYVLSHKWRDYNNFSRTITDNILLKKLFTKLDIYNMLTRTSHPFFRINDIEKSLFIDNFPYEQILHRLNLIPLTDVRIVKKEKLSKLLFHDICPYIERISLSEAEKLINKIDVYERVIQDELRNYLREIGASNMYPRKSDTSLEIADIEDFTLSVNGKEYSFSSVVKGYRSVNTKNISLKDISHQILKAYLTNPDYILLVIAKPLVDGVISWLVKYGIDVGNRNLIILADPIDLVRFLTIRNII